MFIIRSQIFTNVTKQKLVSGSFLFASMYSEPTFIFSFSAKIAYLFVSLLDIMLTTLSGLGRGGHLFTTLAAGEAYFTSLFHTINTLDNSLTSITV